MNVDESAPSSAPAPAPSSSNPAQGSHWPRSDVIACVAAAVAVLSVIVSFWIARNANLDAKRAAIRAQALSLINFNQKMLNNYKCYFVALPDATNIKDNKEEAKKLQEHIDKARKGLAKIDAWGNADLNHYRNTLDTLPGKAAGTNTELVGQLRVKLSSAQITRADQVCMFGG